MPPLKGDPTLFPERKYFEGSSLNFLLFKQKIQRSQLNAFFRLVFVGIRATCTDNFLWKAVWLNGQKLNYSSYTGELNLQDLTHLPQDGLLGQDVQVCLTL